MKEYVDIEEVHPDYRSIPCSECTGELYVPVHFAMNFDSWYCDECKPERLKDLPTGASVEVRI